MIIARHRVNWSLPDSPEPWASGWRMREAQELPAVYRLVELISHTRDREYKEYSAVSGARLNVLTGKGARIGPHREGFSPLDVSATLFLTDLSREQGGAFVVEGEAVQPERGLVVLFVSQSLHWVDPLRDDGVVRASLAICAHPIKDRSV